MKKKFFAQFSDCETSMLIDGDRMEINEPFIHVYSGERLMAIIYQGNVLYCYLTEKKDG